MVKYIYNTYSEKQMDYIFHSFSDSTRRDILERLVNNSLNINEIAEDYAMSLPAISKHIKVLEKAQLIKKEKRGREHTIHLQYETLRCTEQYIAFYTKFWNKKLDALEKFLAKGGADER